MSVTETRKPLTGVLIGKQQIVKLLKQRPHARLKALAEASSAAGTELCFFALNDVNIRKQMIKGVFYCEKERRWKRAQFAYPHIVYKRGGDRKTSGRKYDLFMDQLTGEKTTFINYFQGFSKWDLYKKLLECESIRPHLPETKLLTSPGVLEKMLKKHRTVYVKAARGRQGKQVVKVVKREDGTFLYSHFNKKLTINTARTANILFKKLGRFFRKGKVIVQEAVDLIRAEGAIADMRAEVQRDRKGALGVTAIPVRVGNVNSPVSTHAGCYTFEEFFELYMSYTDEETAVLKQRVESFATEVYKYVEKAYGRVGELGIDLGMDKSGKLWYIETNSQSAKVSLRKAYPKKVWMKAFLNPLAYGVHKYESRA